MRVLRFIPLLILLILAVGCSDSNNPTDPGDVFLKALVSMEFIDSVTDQPIDNASYCATVDTGVSSRQGPFSVGADGRTPRVELAVPESWADKRNQHTGSYWFELCEGEVCGGVISAGGVCYLPKNGTARFQWVEDNFGGGHWLASVTVARSSS